MFRAVTIDFIETKLILEKYEHNNLGIFTSDPEIPKTLLLILWLLVERVERDTSTRIPAGEPTSHGPRVSRSRR